LIQHQGIWLPDNEREQIEWMNKHGELVNGRGTYQIKKLRAAMEHVKQFRTAVDVGSHVGFWSMHLAPKFAHLHAFEPIAEYRECFLRNLHPQLSAGIDVALYDCALGNKSGPVTLSRNPTVSGDTWIRPERYPVAAGRVDEGGVNMRTLDSFELRDVDFLKVDCEGYEYFVLLGAADTLARCKPCVIVEQKRDMAAKFGLAPQQACRFLEKLGAQPRCELGGDFVYSWD